MKRALVFGASGQMGSYLVELLTGKGYEVTGTCSQYFLRPVRGVRMEVVDFTRPLEIERLIERVEPDEVYNLAARMYAPASWVSPTDYLQINGMAVAQILDALFRVNSQARFFQAGSAEVFGKKYQHRLNAQSEIRPQNPYGVAKAVAQELVRVYREEKGGFACTGIFFNAESPRRSEFFFASKVVKTLARIKAGSRETLKLGKLHAVRDWGLAEEYVEAVWRMLQVGQPRDYVIATGVEASCRQFVHRAMSRAQVLDTVSVEFEESPKQEQDWMWADVSDIEKELGWRAKTRFPEVVDYLVEAEINQLAEKVTV